MRSGGKNQSLANVMEKGNKKDSESIMFVFISAEIYQQHWWGKCER